MWSRVLVLALAMTPLTASAGNPWEELMGRKPQTWADPQGRFSLDLPQGWKDTPKSGIPNAVDFWRQHPENGVMARVRVEIRVVPKDVRLAHFVTRVNDENARTAHQLRILGQEQLEVSGSAARRQFLTYQMLGHTELQAEAVQTMFIAGERAFIITLETAAGARSLFWEDHELMMKGFAAEGTVSAPTVSPNGQRKKLRAGEMVNPDELKY